MRSVWNCFYELIINPFEINTTDGWMYVTIIAEQILIFLDHLRKGGSLRELAGKDITTLGKRENQDEHEKNIV